MTRAQYILHELFKYFSEEGNEIETVLDTPKNKKKGKPWDTSRGPEEKDPAVDKFTHKREELHELFGRKKKKEKGGSLYQDEVLTVLATKTKTEVKIQMDSVEFDTKSYADAEDSILWYVQRQVDKNSNINEVSLDTFGVKLTPPLRKWVRKFSKKLAAELKNWANWTRVQIDIDADGDGFVIARMVQR